MLDVMHCEKNVRDNILKTLMGEDDAAVRLDMQERGIRPHLWIERRGPNGDHYWLPDAPYVLSRLKKQEFFLTLQSIKTPSRYASSLHTKVSEGKFQGLKSHDYHVLLQQILPVSLRNVGDKRVVRAIMKLSRVFQRLCMKAVDRDSKAQMMQDV